MRLLVVGAGGHAKVVIDAARAAWVEIAAVVAEPVVPGAEILGHEVLSMDANVDADGFIIAIGDNEARADLYARYLAKDLKPISVIHPSAVIADGVLVGEGSFVAAGVVVNVETQIGANAILNTGCVVDHDCKVGDHAHVGPNSNLCGGVSVGTGALVGAGSATTPLRVIGEWATVGAGAAVISDVPAGEVHAGVPARQISEV